MIWTLITIKIRLPLFKINLSVEEICHFSTFKKHMIRCKHAEIEKNMFEWYRTLNPRAETGLIFYKEEDTFLMLTETPLPPDEE